MLRCLFGGMADQMQKERDTQWALSQNAESAVDVEATGAASGFSRRLS
jgi:hypothetical protein